MKRLGTRVPWEPVAIQFENTTEFSMVLWALQDLLEDKFHDRKQGYAWASGAEYERELMMLQAMVDKLREP